MPLQAFNELGRSSRLLANSYTRLCVKLATTESHVAFLGLCLDHTLVPRGLRLDIDPRCKREEKWKIKAEEERIKTHRREFRSEIYRTRGRLTGIINALRRRGGDDASLAHLVTLGSHRYINQQIKCEKGKNDKFTRLLLSNGPLVFHNRAYSTPDNSKTVINLSAKPLSMEERQLLSLGAKFATPPKRQPMLELTAKCQVIAETAGRQSHKTGTTGDQIASFLNNAEAMLSKAASSPIRKIPKSLALALRNLSKDEDRRVVQADKARALIVMDKPDYTKAILDSLQPPTYKELNRDPSPAFATRLNKDLLTALAGPARPGVRRDQTLDEASKGLYKRLSKTHGRCGAFYIQVKSHKFDLPPQNEDDRLHWLNNLKVRPINPGFRSPDSELAKHLTECLQTLPKPPFSITGPSQVFELLDNWSHAADTCQLISLDVESMFPSIDTSKAVPLLRRLLHQYELRLSEVTPLTPDAVADLLQLSVENCYAVVDDGDRERWFHQKRGLAMGKAYSPPVADHYMGEWESDLKDVARSIGADILDYCRFADDMLLLWRGTDAQLRLLLDRLNAKDPCINVTLEVEKDRSLAFLDIWIERSNKGFKTRVHRKACNTGQVVPFSSFTDPRYLQGAVRADAMRAYRYCRDKTELHREIKGIEKKFLEYGYPKALIDATIEQSIRALKIKARALPAPPSDGLETPKTRLSVPYTGNVYYQLRRAASKIGIDLVCKPVRTLASTLVSRCKHQLPLLQQSGVVYAIQCSCQPNGTNSVYIGETDREISTRLREHRTGWEKRSERSAFGTHGNCQPRFDQARVLAHQPHRRLRLLYESAFIRTIGRRDTIISSPNDESINRNSGTLFLDRWLPLVKDDCLHSTM